MRCWNKRKYNLNPRYGAVVPQEILNETNEFPYTTEAIYNYSNKYDIEFGSSTVNFTNGEILKVSSPSPVL
jgi:hypothetical protein